MLLQAPSGFGVSDTIPALCQASDAVGDAVYISGPKVGERYQVTRIDIDDVVPERIHSVGIITIKESSTECIIQTGNLVRDIYTGLTPGATLFIGTNGRLREGPPARPSTNVRSAQRMGQVFSADTLLLQIESPIILRA